MLSRKIPAAITLGRIKRYLSAAVRRERFSWIASRTRKSPTVRGPDQRNYRAMAVRLSRGNMLIPTITNTTAIARPATTTEMGQYTGAKRQPQHDRAAGRKRAM
jgi:hypothetical protein